MRSLLGRVLLCLSACFGAGLQAQDAVVIYPQFAIGGGFEVVLVLSNASSQPWNGHLLLPEFGAGSGRRWLVNGEERTGSGRLDISLPPRGTRRFRFAAPEGVEAVSGSLQLGADTGSSVNHLAATFFYDYFAGGELVDSIGVAGTGAAFHLIVPVERRPAERVNTGIAVRQRVDSEPAPAGAGNEPVYRLSLLDQEGALLAEEFTSELGARFFDQIFPGVLPPDSPFTGSLALESSSPLYLVALRQRLLDGNRFQLTGVPAWSPAEDAPAADFSARYRVSFQSTWSAQTHPDRFPPGPHFSPLVGATHSPQASFWAPGELASVGIERMAELGSTFPLSDEIQFAISLGSAGSLMRGGGIFRSPGEVALEFEIDQRFPLLTLVSMIAPSPDWFVGVRGLSLFQDGDWVDTLTVELQPYDAGTDNGESYTSPDQDTQPPQPIRQINGPPFLNAGAVAPLGTFTFERIG